MAEVTYRWARFEDMKQMIRLWRQFWPEPPNYEDRLQTKIESAMDLVILAENDGKIVGTVMGGNDGWWGWIYRLAVDPNYQGQGIAGHLLDKILSRLREQNVNYVNLIVPPANINMLRLAESLGFEITEDKRLCIKL